MIALITGTVALAGTIASTVTRVKNGRVKTIEDKAIELEHRLSTARTDLEAMKHRSEECDSHREQLMRKNGILERERTEILMELREVQKQLREALK